MSRVSPYFDPYFGEFRDGQLVHNGAHEITLQTNREFAQKFGSPLMLYGNPELSSAAGFRPPGPDSEIQGLVDPIMLFHATFGATVNTVSYHSPANLGYADLRFGEPAYEGQLIHVQTKTLGRRVSRDGQPHGSVQVRTTSYNDAGEMLLTFSRTVRVSGRNGETFDALDTIATQEDAPPRQLAVSDLTLPKPRLAGLPSRSDDGPIRAFEDFEPGAKLSGLVERGVTLARATWLQIVTGNVAETHHVLDDRCIVYGGVIITEALCSVLRHFPLAILLGKESGSHLAPTYPSDVIFRLFGGGRDEPHERLSSRLEILELAELPDRDDLGVVKARVEAAKWVTGAGEEALLGTRFAHSSELDQPYGARWLPVYEGVYFFAVPRRRALG